MHATLQRIAGPWESANDLKRWWLREKDMRAVFVITGTTPEHRVLYNAFLGRGNDLATKERV